MPVRCYLSNDAVPLQETAAVQLGDEVARGLLSFRAERGGLDAAAGPDAGRQRPLVLPTEGHPQRTPGRSAVQEGLRRPGRRSGGSSGRHRGLKTSRHSTERGFLFDKLPRNPSDDDGPISSHPKKLNILRYTPPPRSLLNVFYFLFYRFYFRRIPKFSVLRMIMILWI